MKKILFVYDIENEELWKDGLWAAVKLLEKDFEIKSFNIKTVPQRNPFLDEKNNDQTDFVLGWGGFGSPVDILLQQMKGYRKGLCLGGYAPYQGQQYDVIFYETEWSRQWLIPQIDTAGKGPITLRHAFGVNTDIYKSEKRITGTRGHEGYSVDLPSPVWDYLTVGAFALWKRQSLLLNKEGHRMAVGQIQKRNLSESLDIIGELLLGGCAVSDMVSPEQLAKLYNASRTVYIPAEEMGGGERAVLEARACGINVEVVPDNAKLKELLTTPVWDQNYYAEELKKGIEECL